MRIVEFRIIIPLTLDEFVRGGLWVHHRVAHLEVSNGEAVELVCDKWTEHEQWGRGRHTERKYHIGGSFPAFLKPFVPASATVVDEKGFYQIKRNAIRVHGNIMSPFMGDNMHFTIDTLIFPDDNGRQENVFHLSAEQLKHRVVEHVDIAEQCNPKPHESGYKREEDARVFQSTKSPAHGPLKDGWIEELASRKQKGTYLCVYKLIQFNFKWFGLQTKTEDIVMNYERNLQTRSHRLMYVTIDEWFDKTKAELEQLVFDGAIRQNEKIGKVHPPSNYDAAEEEEVTLILLEHTRTYEQVLRIEHRAPSSGRKHHKHHHHEQHHHQHHQQQHADGEQRNDDDDGDNADPAADDDHVDADANDAKQQQDGAGAERHKSATRKKKKKPTGSTVDGEHEHHHHHHAEAESK